MLGASDMSGYTHRSLPQPVPCQAHALVVACLRMRSVLTFCRGRGMYRTGLVGAVVRVVTWSCGNVLDCMVSIVDLWSGV